MSFGNFENYKQLCRSWVPVRRKEAFPLLGLYFLHGPHSESPCLWPHTTASGEKVRQNRDGLGVDFEAGRPSSDREFIILMNASTGLPILSADIKSIHVIVRPWTIRQWVATPRLPLRPARPFPILQYVKGLTNLSVYSFLFTANRNCHNRDNSTYSP